MKKTTLLLFTLLAVMSIAITACAGQATEPSSEPASIVGIWELVSYGSPSSLTPAAPDIDTSIEFKSDGTLAGNVGCNGFGGDYNVEGNNIVFGQIISTLMFCEGPVGEQETFTLNVFVESASFALDGNTLTITSADGSSAVVLERK
jgi:heat shock protein HslJ